MWRDSAGDLIIGEQEIQYNDKNGKRSWKWSYADLKRIEIASAKQLVLFTYENQKFPPGAERTFKFTLQDGEITERIYEFLLSRAPRPLLSRVIFSSVDTVFILPVKHRHLLGGCHGKLKVGEERIIYETADSQDGRIWLFKDITSIGKVDLYDFRITTLVETYTFDLKEPMSSKVYDFLWERVYQLDQPTTTRGRKLTRGFTNISDLNGLVTSRTKIGRCSSLRGRGRGSAGKKRRASCERSSALDARARRRRLQET
jgi:hypothetical protein